VCIPAGEEISPVRGVQTLPFLAFKNDQTLLFPLSSCLET
jgi:hypothetical protein